MAAQRLPSPQAASGSVVHDRRTSLDRVVVATSTLKPYHRDRESGRTLCSSRLVGERAARLTWYLEVAVQAFPMEPSSDDHGFDRGTPLDRRYIETFLEQRRNVLHGAVLEVGDDRYSRRFGAPAETTVVDVDPTNADATLIADLCDPISLPAAAFDCIVLTETLHLLSAPMACLTNCLRALVPGGSLLVTVPALKRLSPSDPTSDYWRFTPAGLDLLFARTWDGPFAIQSFGNLRVCLAFLCAQVVEELDDDDFTLNDPRFPLTVAAYAHKK